MTKSELIKHIAEHCGISKSKAGQALDCVIHCIQDTLRRGESISIAGLGTFGTSQRAARTGRNPQTGAPIHIPARRVPTFRAGKALKEAASS
jgi:DNA-binding protein HU-beta